MKKFFRIFASAIVALGAVACQNDLNDTVAPESESVSITVNISEQTRVALGDLDPEKGQQVVFEEGDKICVTSAWGGGADDDHWFTCTSIADNGYYVFTCTDENVSEILGTERYIFYFGGFGAGNGSICNTEVENISGVGMQAGVGSFGAGAIHLDVLPVLKFKSDSNVTFTAGNSTFATSEGYYASTYTTKTKNEWVYLPIWRNDTYTLSASINGVEIKAPKEFTFEKNKIYNLGELNAPALDADPKGINIAIDGNFEDWASIEKNVATVANDATLTDVKTIKSYADKDNLYVYVEFDMTNTTFHMGVVVDTDNNQTTGHHRSSSIPAKGEVILWDYCIGDGSGSILNFVTWSPSFKTWVDGAWSAADTPIQSVTPAALDNGLYAAELAIARTDLNITANCVGVAVFSLANWGYSGIVPSTGVFVIPVYNE